MAQQEPQTTSRVIMIRPVRFTSNPETAASNSFQAEIGSRDPAEIRAAARAEFDGLVAQLEQAGVEVAVFEDLAEPYTPDALFPNNWLTTHADGTAVLYPMQAPSRRKERRPDILDALESDGFRIAQRVDLGPEEGKGRFLEGTGSLILDRPGRVAYACLSPRTDAGLFEEWCQRFGYRPEAFRAVADGTAIYHTNVMMWIGQSLACACLEAIPDPGERERIRTSLEQSGRELIEIRKEQMAAFAGNMLELRDASGNAVLALSQAARNSLDEDQRARLEARARLVSADITTIETYAGGSVRCMLAENFLPREK